MKLFILYNLFGYMLYKLWGLSYKFKKIFAFANKYLILMLEFKKHLNSRKCMDYALVDLKVIVSRLLSN